jgi:alkaline phosphatase
LARLTEEALGVLEKAPAGYVLLVEGARIDDACHGHLAPELLGELLDLDEAIEALLPRAKEGEILLVVTADHETGGFALHYRPRGAPGARAQAATLPSGEVWDPGADFGREEDLEALLRGETPASITWSTGTHTAALVALGALGPGANKLRGMKAQWEVGRALRAWLGAENESAP